MSFFNYYINTIKYENYIIYKKYENIFFKNYLINTFYNDIDLLDNDIDKKNLLLKISEYLLIFLFKPQRLILDNVNYYIAIDIRTNTKYICYRDFCILDFDLNKNNYNCKNDILLYLKNNDILNNIPYILTETNNGYHVYLIDKPRIFNDYETWDFINKFNSDNNYKLYCFIRGFSIRLNKKNEQEKIVNSVKIINNKKQKINNYLYNLFLLNLKHIDKDSIINRI